MRNSVTENRLSDPGLVTDHDCQDFICHRGKGWVCTVDDCIVGFAIADLTKNNIWALFVHPQYEKRGVGRILHDTMLQWYFSQTNTTVWLSTAFDTRAAHFYKKAGWTQTGTVGSKEIKFEMSYADWMNIHSS
ncbi:MAG: GNAT family N-acetyltransferase [Saprospiraceae bacterium]|nr:GNAT family N-acetyltransferase [Saprospiraceae bacterium]MBX7175877.1 GNAT family N-acetyltransferase [Saprospiraceae bacterium]HMW40466.1 GNAT family N-acetyltransferase [Saprospiraceae bacterium]HMX88860.1 GNAT family N-acetyltransferase [Saprospiraceae bacterium]HMZ41011.1 GNAT family N-acetyltransferase [Saprospiraceae bacterium]